MKYQRINGSATTRGFGTGEPPGTENRSLWDVFPAFRNEERILPVPVHPAKRDGRRLSPTAAGRRAETSSALPKPPLAGTAWGSAPCSSFQILARTILRLAPRSQFRGHASSALPCFFQRSFFQRRSIQGR